ncbi:MAG: ABC transporter ATP-binding protein [Phycisphaerales bacterium]
MQDAPAPSKHEETALDGWAVRCAGLGKRFKMYANPWHRVAEWSTLNRLKLHRDFWAVRGVSFELRPGECLGVVGRNGSGKSTLLKMVTGVSIPTEGTAAIRGRVLSLIELGAGLNKDLTGRQNVHNMARLLNFPSDFARSKMEAIESFADIGAFFDRPVRSYSSGMTVRVTFSIFAAFEPEVLIVDEALSVGDIFFVQKCTRRIHELLDSGTTMLLVSHDAGAITNLCDRAILLEQGEVAFQGEPTDTIARYHAALRKGGGKPGNKWHRQDAHPARERTPRVDTMRGDALLTDVLAGNLLEDADDSQRRYGAGGLRISAASVGDAKTSARTIFGIGEDVDVRVVIEAIDEVPEPRAGIFLTNRFGVQVFSQGTMQQGVSLPAMLPGDRLVVTFRVTLSLSPGEYTLGLGTSEASQDGDPNGAIFHDQIEGLGPIRITHPPREPLPFFGVARLPLSIEAAQASAVEPEGRPASGQAT